MNLKSLRYESLVADYECVKSGSLTVLCIKLWMKEDGNLLTNHLQYSLKIIHSKAQTYKNIFFFGHNFISRIAKLEMFHLNIHDIVRVLFPKV